MPSWRAYRVRPTLVMGVLTIACAAQSSHAQSVKVDRTTIVSVGSCNITIAVNLGSASITGCNDLESPAYRRRLLAWFETTEYSKWLKRTTAEVNVLVARADRLDDSLSARRSDVANLSRQVRDVREGQLLDRTRLDDINRQLLDSARDFSGVVVRQDAAMAVLEEKARLNQDELTSISFEIVAMGDRIGLLESDVGYLMDEFRAGRFDKTLVFLGAAVGAMARRSQFNPRYDLVAELFPRQMPEAALLVELSRLAWTESSSYPTLPGLSPQHYKEDFSRTSLGMGALYSVSFGTRSLRAALGGSVGVAHSELANSPYWAAILRTSWARQSLLFSFQIRADSLQRTVQLHEFNELGNATTTVDTRHRIEPSLGLLISTRIR